VSHVSRVGGSRKSEKTKTKLPAVVATVLEEMFERSLDPVRRRPPPRVARTFLAQVGEPALPARRQPERIAVGVVQVADEATRLGGAGDDDVGRAPHRLGLVEPGQRRREERELSAPVGDDDDARPLVGVALADDELVGAARGGHPGRGGPVDRADVVARPVRARAGHLGAASAAHASHRPVRQADQPAARDELEGLAAAHALRGSTGRS